MLRIGTLINNVSKKKVLVVANALDCSRETVRFLTAQQLRAKIITQKVHYLKQCLANNYGIFLASSSILN